ncbi:hypothetical protein L2D08_17195 [Domibacillus sp. PGB-M46]|uniref:hypothetical protein n=1 Tax=Domibacillus sp. PGB-M46 TaxID=2910255 RepID=UPI001F584091|nr:hypothetical protein [Domibacillus sp. PGB-M46]MCI2256091.1 hypothetical protein [Domibacillus sp. PGB-M46]
MKEEHWSSNDYKVKGGSSAYKERAIKMWNITVFLPNKICMYEFETKQEAEEMYQEIHKGSKIISEIIYMQESKTAVSV